MNIFLGFIGLAILGVGIAIGAALVEHRMQRDAVRAGVAHWQISVPETGAATFVWGTNR